MTKSWLDSSIKRIARVTFSQIKLNFNQQPKYVKTYDFIFSDKRPYRILRHATFWTVCLVYYQYTYLIPTNFFPGWHIKAGVAAFDQLGPLKFALFILVNSTRYLLFQMVSIYLIMYILLPRFLLKAKHIAFAFYTILIIIVGLMLWVLMTYYTNSSICSAFGVTGKTISFEYVLQCGTDNVLIFFPTISITAVAIKLLKYWYQKQRESQELITSKAKAELQLLKAQVHPHFLFNTLNNIYSFILTSSPKAPELVKKLSGLLHYIVHECGQAEVLLEKELNMINDYISLEAIRYEQQLDITVDLRGDCTNVKIAPLILLPFIENSFKHGSSKTLMTPWVSLNIIVENSVLFFMVTNSRPEEYTNPAQNGGIGLSNVQKRLQLLYPGNHELKISSEPQCFTVLLEINLKPNDEKTRLRTSKSEKKSYELA